LLLLLLPLLSPLQLPDDVVTPPLAEIAIECLRPAVVVVVVVVASYRVTTTSRRPLDDEAGVTSLSHTMKFCYYFFISNLHTIES